MSSMIQIQIRHRIVTLVRTFGVEKIRKEKFVYLYDTGSRFNFNAKKSLQAIDKFTHTFPRFHFQAYGYLFMHTQKYKPFLNVILLNKC